jgi:transposase
MKKARTFYKKEFKVMIVELIDNGQKISTISNEYSLNQSMVNRWKREFHNKNKPSFTGKGNISLSDSDKEIHRLKKEMNYPEAEPSRYQNNSLSCC